MFAVRCTRKLLRRGAPDTLELPVPPTTLLGDWYANILFVRPEHLVVCMSERTLLPVVVPAKDVRKLPERVATAAEAMLRHIGVQESLVQAEVREMQQGYLAVTASPRIIGSLNDFAYHLEMSCRDEPVLTQFERALELAEMPSSAIQYAFPIEATRKLFASTAGSGGST